MSDLYQTLAGPSIGEFRDRGSKFIAYAYPVFTNEEWRAHLAALKKEHLKARHHCYAYRFGLDKNNFRANDDGEPSGTAGRPILGQIDSFGLTNVIVIVVRYFGGTKLGTSGLKNAYKLSAAAALEAAEIIEKVVEDIYQIEFDYALMSPVMNAVKGAQLEIVTQHFEAAAQLQIAIPKSKVVPTLHQLKATIAGLRLEEIEPEAELDGLDIQYAYTR